MLYIIWVTVICVWHLLAPDSPIPFTLTLLLGLALFMEFTGYLTRAVHRNVPRFRLNQCITPFLLHGVNGTRAILHHRRARIMIQAVKSLGPPGSRKERRVGLRVIKEEVRHLKRFDWGLRVRMPLRGVTDPLFSVAIWWLPSPHKGKPLEEVDCGASISRVQAAVQKIISEDPALAENPVFDVWCEKGGVSPTRGKFEDYGEGDQAEEKEARPEEAERDNP